MTKQLQRWAPLALCLLAPHPAQAVIGALDPVPAATLLLPYFEVDLNDPNGETTLLSVANAGEAPVIAHVTLWSDLSVPTLNFNLYLTGFDNVSFNLRTLFAAGAVPSTSHSNLGISPVGLFSTTFNPLTGAGAGTTSCDGQLPAAPLNPFLLQHIQDAHTGVPSQVFQARCAGIDHGDQVARGYVTIDHVSFCTLDYPGDVGYFVQGGQGAASNVNALLGDYVYLNPSTNRAEAHPMVHIEASSTDPLTQPSHYTFYRRYSSGADNRESLGTQFWSRYTANGNPSSSSSLLYWRDSKRVITPFVCGPAPPAPFPLSTNQIVVFDEAENPEVPETSPFSPALFGLVAFPYESGRVEVGSADFPVTPSAGWMFLNMNSAVVSSFVPFEPLLQNWVGVSFETSGGQYRFGFDAFPVVTAAALSEHYLPTCDGTPDPPGCLAAPLAPRP